MLYPQFGFLSPSQRSRNNYYHSTRRVSSIVLEIISPSFLGFGTVSPLESRLRERGVKSIYWIHEQLFSTTSFMCPDPSNLSSRGEYDLTVLKPVHPSQFLSFTLHLYFPVCYPS